MLLESTVHTDSRGEFLETYRKAVFAEAGIEIEFLQANMVGSLQGVLRGLHYQLQYPQGKLIQVIRGEIYDVAVDLRQNSGHFGQAVGLLLSAEDRRQLWVPEGFAHGYYVLSERADVSYLVTNYYAPEWERVLAWNDPALGIDWPLIPGKEPILSQKDRDGKCLKDAELYP